ncbi:MAG: FAD-dependent monooxygenase [Sulfitobacter sp.]
MPSDVIVIGAGIGGLAAAIAMARHGHRITVLERAETIQEVGAGLQISPNGLAVLRALGLEPALVATGAVQAQRVVLRDYQRVADVARLDLARLTPDQRYYFVHRADLIDILLAAATSAGVDIQTGAQVSQVIPGHPAQVRLTDGTVQSAALIVAADGVKSVARGVLNGSNNAVFTGQVAWRATLPADADARRHATVTMGPGRHTVHYPLRGSGMMNIVAVEERDDWVGEGWNLHDDPANLRASFSRFQGPIAQYLNAVREVQLWGLFRHPVATHWHKDNVVLLGDAAHPTLPFLAQGANMALEDAWVLADATATSTDNAALGRYQSARHKRVSKVIHTASGNAWKYHLRAPPVRWAAHMALQFGSRVAPGRMIGQYDWLYGTDVTRT